MPVRKLTEKEELLESDRICSIAFAGSWSREEAIKRPGSALVPAAGILWIFQPGGRAYRQHGAAGISGTVSRGSRSHDRRGRRSLSARAPV